MSETAASPDPDDPGTDLACMRDGIGSLQQFDVELAKVASDLAGIDPSTSWSELCPPERGQSCGDASPPDDVEAAPTTGSS